MRAETAALLAAAYLVAMFAWHRVRLYRRRAAGPSLDLLRRFDYRSVWGEVVSGNAGEGDPARVAIARIGAGDLDGAAEAARGLAREKAGPLLATIDLARAERCAAVRDHAGARKWASAAVEKAGRVPLSAGSAYLDAHARLAWLTHDVNLEIAVGAAVVALLRALRRFGDSPFLHYGLAHAQALLGRHEEALDEIGRALYYAHGDPFYVRAILEDPFVTRARPALAAQCRGAGVPTLPRPGDGR